MTLRMNCLAAAALALVAGQALAADDTADVKLTGQIVPAACKPVVAGGAVFDYGGIKAASLAKDDYTVLGKTSLQLTVTCNSPMKVAFSGVDARAGTVVAPTGKYLVSMRVPVTENDAAMFGLGTTPEGKGIGGYKILLEGDESLVVDGVQSVASPIKSTDGGKTWLAPDEGCDTCGYLYPQGTGVLMSITKKGETEPMAFTVLSTPLRMQAALNKSSELDLTKMVNLDGQMTIQMTYL